MTVRIRSRVWASEIERVSSRGAVPKTSAVTASWVWSLPNQSRNEVMPAWATSPTHERSSADNERYHSWSASICCTAAAPRSPAARATRERVAADGVGRADGIRAVYLYAVHNRSRRPCRSVGAGLHGGPVERVVVAALRERVVGDLVVAARGQLAEERAVLDEQLPLLDRLSGVDLELRAAVGDVEVAHGQLADPVERAEGGVLDAFHRQLVGVVAEVLAAGVDDRVVLAPAQPQGDLAGDQRGDPALDGLAHHQALRVEPAALVEQPAELTALGVVVGEGVLVVHRVEQPLVGDVQQGHARRLVDAARLGLDDPVLDLVGHADAVAAADGVDLVDERQRVEGPTVDGHGSALDEGERDVLGVDAD